MGLGCVFLIACGRATPQGEDAALKPAPSKQDPETEQYKKLRTADYEVDGAFQELNDSIQKCKALAPQAKDEAGKALESVSELLDGAGERLSDYENVPDTVEEFKKDFTAQDERRLRGIKIALDALAKVQDAADILSDLGQNVPPEFKNPLDAIEDSVGQAASDLQGAVKDMGGQLPEVGQAKNP